MVCSECKNLYRQGAGYTCRFCDGTYYYGDITVIGKLKECCGAFYPITSVNKREYRQRAKGRYRNEHHKTN